MHPTFSRLPATPAPAPPALPKCPPIQQTETDCRATPPGTTPHGSAAGSLGPGSWVSETPVLSKTTLHRLSLRATGKGDTGCTTPSSTSGRQFSRHPPALDRPPPVVATNPESLIPANCYSRASITRGGRTDISAPLAHPAIFEQCSPRRIAHQRRRRQISALRRQRHNGARTVANCRGKLLKPPHNSNAGADRHPAEHRVNTATRLRAPSTTSRLNRATINSGASINTLANPTDARQNSPGFSSLHVADRTSCVPAVRAPDPRPQHLNAKQAAKPTT